MGEDSAVLDLWRACYAGNTEHVEELIEDDVDFCQRDRNGETVLHMAARSDNPEVLNLLLDHLSPDVQNHNHQTPLHLAAIKGHIAVVNVLLQAVCDLEHKTKYSEMTALHLACQHGTAPVVAALLDAGAICNVPDTIGKPPEFYATDPEIHSLFRQHARYCIHHNYTDQPPPPITQHHPDPSYNSTDNTDDDVDDVDDEDDEDNEDASKTRRKKDDAATNRTAKHYWKKASRAPKKIKINHGLGFSEQYKRRMEVNVFDRLMGSKKK